MFFLLVLVPMVYFAELLNFHYFCSVVGVSHECLRSSCSEILLSRAKRCFKAFM